MLLAEIVQQTSSWRPAGFEFTFDARSRVQVPHWRWYHSIEAIQRVHPHLTRHDVAVVNVFPA